MRTSTSAVALAFTIIAFLALTGPAAAGCAIEVDEITGAEHIVCGGPDDEAAWDGMVREAELEMVTNAAIS